MTPETGTLVRYRFERAREALAEARLLAGAGHVNTAVNRLYYAAFYAVSASLLARGLSSAKHSGVRALFHANLVKTGIVPVELGRFFDTVFDSRQKGDYADLVRFTEAEVAPWFAKIEDLVRILEQSTEVPGACGHRSGSPALA